MAKVFIRLSAKDIQDNPALLKNVAEAFRSNDIHIDATTAETPYSPDTVNSPRPQLTDLGNSQTEEIKEALDKQQKQTDTNKETTSGESKEVGLPDEKKIEESKKEISTWMDTLSKVNISVVVNIINTVTQLIEKMV